MAVVLTCVLIMVARITDITLDTIRTVAIVQGRRVFAGFLGFFEALIYIIVVANVLDSFKEHRVYAFAYAAGFAAGTYFGILIEGQLAFGAQLVSVITRKGVEMVGALRAEGYRVTELDGQGRDGAVQVLYIQVPRRETRLLTRRARELDPECFYVVNDVRRASAAVAEGRRGTVA